MAHSLENGRVAAKDASRNPLIVAHLQAVLQQEPENTEARKNLAELAIRTNTLSLALQYLPAILDEQPEARILYARALVAVKQFDKAKSEADRAITYYEREFAKPDAQHEPEFFIDWARAHVLHCEFDKGRQRLYEGLVHVRDHGGDNSGLRQAGSKLIIQWTRNLQLTERDSIDRQLRLLSEALKLAPDNPSVLTRIAELSKASGSDASAAMDSLKQAVANGTAPPAAHFVLGTQAAILETDFNEAKAHFEKAIQLNPDAVEPINNLAWIMAHAEEPRLDLALKLADQAKKINARHPEVRDTRGHILILLKRYEEGITELEYALKFKKDNVQLHGALALAYKESGQPEIAKLHTEKVAKLEAAARKSSQQ